MFQSIDIVEAATINHGADRNPRNYCMATLLWWTPLQWRWRPMPMVRNLGMSLNQKKRGIEMELKVGMKVSFGRPNGEKTIGIVKKVNQKTVKIEQTEIRGRQKTHRIGTVWNVAKSPNLITIIERRFAQSQKRTDAQIINDLQRVECRLSPENLSCDGELSRTQVRQRYNRLMSEKKALINELGREPTFDELWD